MKLYTQLIAISMQSGKEKFGLIVSLCTRGQDEASDCVAPQLSRVCRAAPLMAIYCFLNPKNGRLRTTEFQLLFSTSVQSLNLSAFRGPLTLSGMPFVLCIQESDS